jgi:predicted  nucleic acid-binding Zn-ribbon protein
MQKKITESKMTLALIGAALVLSGMGCSKQEAKKRQPAPTGVVTPTEAPAPAPVSAAEPALVNTTNSQVVKVSENKYMVLPPAQKINLGLDNEPIKSSCKAISKMNHETAALNKSKLILEAELKEIKMKIAHKIAFDHDVSELQKQEEETQSKVDDVQTSLNEKAELMKNAKSEIYELPSSIEVEKTQLMKNIETLKAANVGMVFEIKAPTKTVIKAKAGNGETRAEQSQAINLIDGAFDESAASTKVKVSINYDVLCTARSLKSESKSLIEMSFAD